VYFKIPIRDEWRIKWYCIDIMCIAKNPITGFELYNHQYLSFKSELDIPHVGQLKGAKYRVKIQHDIDKKSREKNQQSFT
jgi:hypothetical protein